MKYLETPLLIHSISPSIQLAIKSKRSIQKWIINRKVINKPLRIRCSMKILFSFSTGYRREYPKVCVNLQTDVR